MEIFFCPALHKKFLFTYSLITSSIGKVGIVIEVNIFEEPAVQWCRTTCGKTKFSSLGQIAIFCLGSDTSQQDLGAEPRL